MPTASSATSVTRWRVLGPVLVVLAVAAVVLWGMRLTQGAVTPTVTGYEVLSDSQVRVEFDVSRPAGTELLCMVAALDLAHGRVGAAPVVVPAAQESSSHVSALVRTSQRAVTGVVDSCVRR